MSAAIKALARRIRLALHRHDRIECWCEVPVPDLPVNNGPGQCPDCWVLPGVVHELSCEQVSPAQFAEFLARGTR